METVGALRTTSPVCELIASSSWPAVHAKKTCPLVELLEKAVIEVVVLLFVSFNVSYHQNVEIDLKYHLLTPPLPQAPMPLLDTPDARTFESVAMIFCTARFPPTGNVTPRMPCDV